MHARSPSSSSLSEVKIVTVKPTRSLRVFQKGEIWSLVSLLLLLSPLHAHGCFAVTKADLMTIAALKLCLLLPSSSPLLPARRPSMGSLPSAAAAAALPD